MTPNVYAIQSMIDSGQILDYVGKPYKGRNTYFKSVLDDEKSCISLTPGRRDTSSGISDSGRLAQVPLHAGERKVRFKISSGRIFVQVE